MRVPTGRLVAGAVAVAVVAGGLGGVLGVWLSPGRADHATAATTATPAAATGASCDVTAVAARAFPSLVTINVRGRSPGAAGIGSGSVLDTQGHVLTNDHVIATGASGGSITIDFARGNQHIAATIVGRDPGTDLAVLRVPAGTAGLTPIAFGSSAGLVVGQPVVAAGSPLGLNGTITSGVVSALSRYIDVGAGEQPAALVNAVQTDAAVNPGNSGGPLLDCGGRQVGVNTAGAQVPGGGGGSIGLNFAIPIDFARSVADQIVRTGRATHPEIGVLAVTVTAEMASATGLPRGALVEQVVGSLGAARAGIQVDDVITKVGDRSIGSVDEMLVALRANSSTTVSITFTRGGAQRSVQVPVTVL